MVFVAIYSRTGGRNQQARAFVSQQKGEGANLCTGLRHCLLTGRADLHFSAVINSRIPLCCLPFPVGVCQALKLSHMTRFPGELCQILIMELFHFNTHTIAAGERGGR